MCLNALCSVQLDANWYNWGFNMAAITTFEPTQSGFRSELIPSVSFWSCCPPVFHLKKRKSKQADLVLPGAVGCRFLTDCSPCVCMAFLWLLQLPQSKAIQFGKCNLSKLCVCVYVGTIINLKLLPIIAHRGESLLIVHQHERREKEGTEGGP